MTCYNDPTLASGYASLSPVFVPSCTPGSGSNWVVSPMADVFAGVPPQPDQDIDGDKLLQKVRQWWATYISTVTDADLDLLTLWAAHTHLVVETYTTPRL